MSACTAPAAVECRNCSTPLTGRHCSQCGAVFAMLNILLPRRRELIAEFLNGRPGELLKRAPKATVCIHAV